MLGTKLTPNSQSELSNDTMRKRKSSEPSEEENTQVATVDRTSGKAQVIRVVHISNLFWLCLGLVIGQLLCYFSY